MDGCENENSPRYTLLCQEEGHFWFFFYSLRICVQGETEMTILSQIGVAKLFNIFLRIYIFFCIILCPAVSSSCLNTLVMADIFWCVSNVLFAEGDLEGTLFISWAVIPYMGVVTVHVTVLFSQLDKYHKMTDLCCRAAFRLWHSKAQISDG